MPDGDLDAAPRLDPERECPVCNAEGSYVRYDNEAVCRNCGHSPHTTPTVEQSDDPWAEWWEQRKEYSGFTGEDRVRMVGGFAGVWFD